MLLLLAYQQTNICVFSEGSDHVILKHCHHMSWLTIKTTLSIPRNALHPTFILSASIIMKIVFSMLITCLLLMTCYSVADAKPKKWGSPCQARKGATTDELFKACGENQRQRIGNM